MLNERPGSHSQLGILCSLHLRDKFCSVPLIGKLYVLVLQICGQNQWNKLINYVLIW